LAETPVIKRQIFFLFIVSLKNMTLSKRWFKSLLKLLFLRDKNTLEKRDITFEKVVNCF